MAKASDDQCIIVTLIRGKTYYYKDTRFDRDEPQIVEDEELAQILEDDVAEVVDREGDIVIKPRFDVDYEGSRAEYNEYLQEKRAAELRAAKVSRKRLRTTSESPLKAKLQKLQSLNKGKMKPKEEDDSTPRLKKRIKGSAKRAS